MIIIATPFSGGVRFIKGDIYYYDYDHKKFQSFELVYFKNNNHVAIDLLLNVIMIIIIFQSYKV